MDNHMVTQLYFILIPLIFTLKYTAHIYMYKLKFRFLNIL